ncbi:ethylbenzene dehydrogenase [Geothermobacter ehrlichii]|uniref:Ethylbenzene dehydrogenase n=1 Tax=Geothermobacter ehrlichii TaxID=213224 RepID=A0A5D3WHT4_9BACT|nr:ethylbenzene dehydrogenase-related protein [Geothermobacter ehrlichii]TYO97124.1 ethylbenzene dehydrogenase [Geothermobacter ehrlichii]
MNRIRRPQIHVKYARLPGVLLLLAVVGISALFGGCRQPEADRLYALYLEHPPTEADWQRALPHRVEVRGGRVHKVEVFPDIDKDTVHTSTPSCHHGGTIPRPLPVEMKAFYTDRDLFLRLRWRDLTRDDAMNRWTFDGTKWVNNGALEDGFGMLWRPDEESRPFTCSLACHIEDFGVAGSTFHATNHMKLERPGPWYDLWNWKADRTGRLGFADDRWLDHKGMHGDLPGELHRPNSMRAEAGEKPFGPDDQPIYDGKGRRIDGSFRPAGSQAPGWLTERPSGRRADIRAVAIRDGDFWVVTLRRALDTGDPHDIVFSPAARNGFAFGLSVMDHTLDEHYASRAEERLVLLPAAAGDVRQPE